MPLEIIVKVTAQKMYENKVQRGTILAWSFIRTYK